MTPRSSFPRLQQFINSITNLHFIDYYIVVCEYSDGPTLLRSTQAPMSNISFAQFRPKRSSLLNHSQSEGSSRTSSNRKEPFEIFVDQDCINVDELEQAELLKMAPAGPYLTIREEFTARLTSNELMDRMAGLPCPQTGDRIVPKSIQDMVDLVFKHPERYEGYAHFMTAAIVKHYGYLLVLRDTSYYTELRAMYAPSLYHTWAVSLEKAIDGRIDAEVDLRVTEEQTLTAKILHMIPLMIERALRANYSHFLTSNEGFMPLDHPVMPKYASATRSYQKRLCSALKRSFIDMTVLRHEVFEGRGEIWAHFFAVQKDLVERILFLVDRRVAIYDEMDSWYLRDITGRNEKLPDPRLQRPDGRDGDENAFL